MIEPRRSDQRIEYCHKPWAPLRSRIEFIFVPLSCCDRTGVGKDNPTAGKLRRGSMILRVRQRQTIDLRKYSLPNSKLITTQPSRAILRIFVASFLSFWGAVRVYRE